MDITGLLHRWSEGEQAALAELTPLVYEELRHLARHHLAGERQEQTLTTTALVHEAWLRLVTVKDARWQDRAHFFALCAQLMRRILVDHARARLRARRGGGVQRVSLEEALLISDERSPLLVALDDALNALSTLDPRQGRVVELRFFGGLSVEDAAAVLKISPDSVKRDWRLAKAWLMREVSRAEAL
jgi:RNA polymerase sigma factor (TIGR02999 family)